MQSKHTLREDGEKGGKIVTNKRIVQGIGDKEGVAMYPTPMNYITPIPQTTSDLKAAKA